MRRLVGYLGIAVAVSVFVAAFVAYFIVSIDPVTHVHRDGWGRPLRESPVLLRFVLPVERDFPGWGWWAADFVIFWGGAAIAYNLITFGFKSPRAQKTATALPNIDDTLDGKG